MLRVLVFMALVCFGHVNVFWKRWDGTGRSELGDGAGRSREIWEIREEVIDISHVC